MGPFFISTEIQGVKTLLYTSQKIVESKVKHDFFILALSVLGRVQSSGLEIFTRNVENLFGKRGVREIRRKQTRVAKNRRQHSRNPFFFFANLYGKLIIGRGGGSDEKDKKKIEIRRGEGKSKIRKSRRHSSTAPKNETKFCNFLCQLILCSLYTLQLEKQLEIFVREICSQDYGASKQKIKKCSMSKIREKELKFY